jgi:hypothetical protein
MRTVGISRIIAGTGHWLRDETAALPNLELWVRDSEHESHVSSRGLESRPGDVVLDVMIDHGQCLA